MREIIKEQGGNPDIGIQDLKLAEYKYEFPSRKKGVVTSFNNLDLTIIAKILGCPSDKKAGIYIERRIDERVDKNDILCVLYSSDKWDVCAWLSSTFPKTVLSHFQTYS